MFGIGIVGRRWLKWDLDVRHGVEFPGFGIYLCTGVDWLKDCLSAEVGFTAQSCPI